MNRDVGPTISTGSQLYSQIYKGHIVVAAQNGAIQALRLPSAEQVARMIEADPGARQYIDTVHPLSSPNSWDRSQRLRGLPWDNTDAVGTQRFLTELSQDQHWDRHGMDGITDIHTLMAEVPFDFGKHIQSGILKPLADIPGKDGRSVWDTIDIADIQSPKHYTW